MSCLIPEKEISIQGLRAALSNRPNKTDVSNLSQIQSTRNRILYNTARGIQVQNPAITGVIHHRQSILKST
jgi:hypothetical protein